MSAASKYQSLVPPRLRWTGRYGLYLGPDHLLHVQDVGLCENYRRFFFADIQVIHLLRTRIGMIWNGIWGGGAFFSGLIAIASDDSVAKAVFGGIAGAFLLALVINLVLGPTCALYVQTAVQLEHLAAVGRLRRTGRLLTKIQPLIVAAQGAAVAPETRPAESSAPVEPVSSAAPAAESAPPVT